MNNVWTKIPEKLENQVSISVPRTWRKQIKKQIFQHSDLSWRLVNRLRESKKKNILKAIRFNSTYNFLAIAYKLLSKKNKRRNVLKVENIKILKHTDWSQTSLSRLRKTFTAWYDRLMSIWPCDRKTFK